MLKIRLIDSPRFDVNFQPFVNAKRDVQSSFLQKVRSVVSRPFELTGFVFIAITKSGYATLGYSWISFKLNVLNFYGSLSNYKPPGDFYLVMFKTVFWAGEVFWCFTTTALRLLMDQIDPPSKTFLTVYTEGKIDTVHLRTKDLTIDVSAIPASIKVDTLLTLFEETNYTDQTKPGYMPPSTRQEGSMTYTVDELNESLKKFMEHVNGRVPFLGTPPAYDTPRLMAFYQQIEDAIRFSIHKANQDLQQFQTQNGTDPAGYQEAQMRQYKGLLETKGRIALDMAIAGKHCGARYMGEAMSTYFSLRGETEVDGTLQDSLIELLASKRNEIAQRQVYQHLGSDTHALSKYMAMLGAPLGLPGTGNVVEHLRKGFDHDRFLRLFFKEYTVDCIIDVVQAKIKKSQPLREKITDWLKDQVGDWNKDSANVQEYQQKIQAIIDEKVEMKMPAEAEQFERLISHLREKKVAWPTENDWDDFVTELFILPAAKDWFKAEFGTNLKEVQPKKMRIQDAFRESVLGSEAANALKETIVSGQSLALATTAEKKSEQQKIEKIRKILLFPEDTLSRVLKGEVALEVAVKDQLDLTRRGQFLRELKLDKIATDGVSDALLEWILVSQEILLPQEMEE
jgi:hypothetical protein